MDKENVGLNVKSEPSSFIVQDYTPKNNVLLTRTGSSKSSFVKEEKYEFNAPKYYDFEAGTPSTNVDAWFDTLVDTPCNNKPIVNPSMVNSQEKNFTPPTSNNKANSIRNSLNFSKTKGKEIDTEKEKEVKIKREEDHHTIVTEIEKEKENLNSIYKSSSYNRNSINNNNNNDNYSINTNHTKISNILSSWDTTDNNKILVKPKTNMTSLLSNSLKTEIHDLNKGRKSFENHTSTTTLDNNDYSIPPPTRKILATKSFNTTEFTNKNRVPLYETRRSASNEIEKPVEFESRINNILKFKNTLRRQSKPYKRRLKLTIPKSPNITKVVPRKSRDNWVVQPVMEKKKPKISLEKLFNKPFEIQVPHRMLPLPKFSLSSDKMRQERLSAIKQNLIKEQESDQQKSQFHASEASNYLISNRPNINVVERLYHIKRNVPAIEKKEKVFKFKARPVPKTRPFIIKRMDKPLTEAISPILHSKIRAKERQLFDEKVHQHQLEMEKLQKEMELEKEKRERKRIKLLRKKLVHHAKPAPNPNIVFRIKPSNQQLTIPKSPSFGHQRPYKSIQMDSIHKQMGRRLRSLSNDLSRTSYSSSVVSTSRKISEPFSFSVSSHFNNNQNEDQESLVNQRTSIKSLSGDNEMKSLTTSTSSSTLVSTRSPLLRSSSTSSSTTLKHSQSSSSDALSQPLHHQSQTRLSNASKKLKKVKIEEEEGNSSTLPIPTTTLSKTSSTTTTASSTSTTSFISSSNKSSQNTLFDSLANKIPNNPQENETSTHSRLSKSSSNGRLKSKFYPTEAQSQSQSLSKQTDQHNSPPQSQLKQKQKQTTQQNPQPQQQPRQKQNLEVSSQSSLQSSSTQALSQQQIKKTLTKVKKEVISPPKSHQDSHKNTTKDSKNSKTIRPIKQEPETVNEIFSSPSSVLDMFSPAKKRPFPVEMERPKKRNLFSDQNQNESYRTLKLFETVHKHSSQPSQKTTTTTKSTTSSDLSNLVISSPPFKTSLVDHKSKEPTQQNTLSIDQEAQKQSLIREIHQLNHPTSSARFESSPNTQTLEKNSENRKVGPTTEPPLNSTELVTSNPNPKNRKRSLSNKGNTSASLIISSDKLKVTKIKEEIPSPPKEKLQSKIEYKSEKRSRSSDATLIRSTSLLSSTKTIANRHEHDNTISNTNIHNNNNNNNNSNNINNDNNNNNNNNNSTSNNVNESSPSLSSSSSSTSSTPNINTSKKMNKNETSQPSSASNSSNKSPHDSLLTATTTSFRRINKSRSKSFIDTKHRSQNNYSLQQKARLSDVSMNIKQNILNDIMSFSPLRDTASPSPFLMNETDQVISKRRRPLDSPILKKFEIAQRESEYEQEQRRKSEFLNRVLYGDKVKKKEEGEGKGKGEDNQTTNQHQRRKSHRSSSPPPAPRKSLIKSENYKVQWITIDEIKKKNRKVKEEEEGERKSQGQGKVEVTDKETESLAKNSPNPLFFEITPIKSTPLKSQWEDSSSAAGTSSSALPHTSHLYTTPDNPIPFRQDDSEPNPFIESTSKFTTFISKVTRRTSRRLTQTFLK